ncbi:TRAP transporter substrate-binding protein [Larsenimonas suaedae]|uniref:TRAP transporter substrate-binding protein n=1 Tax=Larsenimonas suaedae TaxID=1851019 RepID=A0ABU1GVY3_9GAMM|nr:TRAP transporter substrate-binding protein [Larsenimonas suaedae]MCM2973319.1 TRAP transporter substrate-binding protein [Larsenimonas suaedae]MDR5896212.1 TRAP transporter substrate-binding protein [Larsenimonas suaedae]
MTPRMTRGALKHCQRVLLLGVGLALGAASPSASAVTTLRITHFLPAVASVQRQVLDPWCDELEARSGHEIRCQIYPSMQLGGIPSQLPDMVRNGVVDIAWTALGYSAGRFPRSEALELPFMLPAGGDEGSRIAWAFTQGPARKDFADYHVLAVHSDGGAVFHSRDTLIYDAADMAGLKLRAPTRMASRMIDALGASAVSMPPAQIADTLAKGVINGASAGWEVVPPTKLDEVTRYHTEPAAHQATPTVTVLAFLMNKQSYERLPDKARAALDALSGEGLSRRFGKAWDDAIVRVRAKVKNDPDQTVITLDDAAYNGMRDASRSVTEDWMASREGGVDRAALVRALEALVEQKEPALE